MASMAAAIRYFFISVSREIILDEQRQSNGSFDLPTYAEKAREQDGKANARRKNERHRADQQLVVGKNNVRLPDEHTLTLRQAKDLAMNVAAGVLNRPIADVTRGSTLDSDDLDLVLAELSIAGIEVKGDRIETVGDLIEHVVTGEHAKESRINAIRGQADGRLSLIEALARKSV